MISKKVKVSVICLFWEAKTAIRIARIFMKSGKYWGFV